MDNYEDKIDNLNGRISKISNQISELQQTQINLMVLKQKIQWDNNKDMLEETIQKMLKEDPDILDDYDEFLRFSPEKQILSFEFIV